MGEMMVCPFLFIGFDILKIQFLFKPMKVQPSIPNHNFFIYPVNEHCNKTFVYFLTSKRKYFM